MSDSVRFVRFVIFAVFRNLKKRKMDGWTDGQTLVGASKNILEAIKILFPSFQFYDGLDGVGL